MQVTGKTNRRIPRRIFLATALLLVTLLTWSAISSAKTTLWIVTHNNAAFVAWVSSRIEEYAKIHPDIEIQHSFYPSNELQQKLLVTLASGSPPDICNVYYPTAQDFIRMGYIDQAPKFVVEDLKANYIPAAWAGMTFNNVLYGYPTETSLILPIVNETVYENGGVAYPDSIEDLLPIQRKLTQYNPDGTMKQQGVNFFSGASVWVMLRWAPLLWGHGVELVNEAGVPAFNTPQGVRATELFQELAPIGGLDILKDLNGTITQGAHYRSTAQNANSPARLKALPALRGLDGQRVAPMYHWGTLVTKASKHKEEAWEFVRWLNSPENKRSLTDATSLPPITYAGVRDYYNDPWMRTFAESFVYGKMFPSVQGWPAAEEAIISIIHQQLLKNRVTSVQEVLLNAETTAKAAMGLL